MLHCGAGSSNLGRELVAQSEVRISELVEIDYVDTKRPEVIEMDVRNMPDPEWTRAFDVLIEKGCFDALAFDASEKPLGDAIRECARVLDVTNSGSRLFSISNEAPEIRLDLLRETLRLAVSGVRWGITFQDMAQGDDALSPSCYLYICRPLLV